MPPAELRAAMRWRLKDSIDFRVEDAVIDVFDVPDQNRGGHGRMMYAVAARRSAVDAHTAALAATPGFDASTCRSCACATSPRCCPWPRRGSHCCIWAKPAPASCWCAARHFTSRARWIFSAGHDQRPQGRPDQRRRRRARAAALVGLLRAALRPAAHHPHRGIARRRPRRRARRELGRETGFEVSTLDLDALLRCRDPDRSIDAGVLPAGRRRRAARGAPLALSAAMEQQVNLYQPILGAEKRLFSARAIGVACASRHVVSACSPATAPGAPRASSARSRNSRSGRPSELRRRNAPAGAAARQRASPSSTPRRKELAPISPHASARSTSSARRRLPGDRLCRAARSLGAPPDRRPLAARCRRRLGRRAAGAARRHALDPQPGARLSRGARRGARARRRALRQARRCAAQRQDEAPAQTRVRARRARPRACRLRRHTDDRAPGCWQDPPADRTPRRADAARAGHHLRRPAWRSSTSPGRRC